MPGPAAPTPRGIECRDSGHQPRARDASEALPAHQPGSTRLQECRTSSQSSPPAQRVRGGPVRR
eukprot:8578164-Heterocapsa_arctica.AAC.1